jgi:ABC-type sugar transport system permease subunit
MSARRRLKDALLALLMLAPSLAVLGTFVIYPLIRAVFLGRQRCSIDRGAGGGGKVCETTGWQQYSDVFRSNEFQDALATTVKFAAFTVPLGLVFGVGLAVLADKHIRGSGVFRTIFSSTVATSVAVASLMWLFLLNPSVGVLADWLGGVFKNPGLLKDSDWALWSVGISSVWANLGFTFIVVTAALQGVPAELYESSYMDGANSWTRFTNVTVPLLGPTLLFVGVVLLSRAFQAYGEFDLLTGGGPRGTTTSLTYLIYGQNSTIPNEDDGLKATVAVLLFAVLLVVSAAQFRGLEKRVHYGN